MIDKDIENMTTEELRAEVFRLILALTDDQCAFVLDWINCGMPDPIEWLKKVPVSDSNTHEDRAPKDNSEAFSNSILSPTA